MPKRHYFKFLYPCPIFSTGSESVCLLERTYKYMLLKKKKELEFSNQVGLSFLTVMFQCLFSLSFHLPPRPLSLLSKVCRTEVSYGLCKSIRGIQLHGMRWETSEGVEWASRCHCKVAHCHLQKDKATLWREVSDDRMKANVALTFKKGKG